MGVIIASVGVVAVIAALVVVVTTGAVIVTIRTVIMLTVSWWHLTMTRTDFSTPYCGVAL